MIVLWIIGFTSAVFGFSDYLSLFICIALTFLITPVLSAVSKALFKRTFGEMLFCTDYIPKSFADALKMEAFSFFFMARIQMKKLSAVRLIIGYILLAFLTFFTFCA